MQRIASMSEVSSWCLRCVQNVEVPLAMRYRHDEALPGSRPLSMFSSAFGLVAKEMPSRLVLGGVEALRPCMGMHRVRVGVAD